MGHMHGNKFIGLRQGMLVDQDIQIKPFAPPSASRMGLIVNMN